MRVTDTIAPTYQRLRPLKQLITPTFPVYHDLADALVASEAHPDPRVAHVLATCAGYAYSDESTVATMMARLGLEENRCLRITELVDAMFICSTTFIVQSRCGRVVVVCYRGTELGNFINWLTDADVHPQKVNFALPGGAGGHEVHAGFYRNVRATRYEVIAALERALAGQSIVAGAPAPEGPLEALFVTGHSLGAAMAAMLGVMLVTEPAYAPLLAKLRAVYTFGQPMIAAPDLAAACASEQFLGTRLIRYVYGQDLVASLPPAVSGDFAHFGQEYQWTNGQDAAWRRNVKPIRQLQSSLFLAMAGLGFIAHKLRRFENLAFACAIDDHAPQNYIAALTPPHVRSEFGD